MSEICFNCSTKTHCNEISSLFDPCISSCIPDRQRTFRELEFDKAFLKDANLNCWNIKHGPDDYKTGSSYGDRRPPLLVLAEELTPSIDDFLDRYRLTLSPNSNHFFVQPRMGNEFTQDSVYNLVARSCYRYIGKTCWEIWLWHM